MNMVKMVYQRAAESHIAELYGKALKQVHRFSNSRCKNLDDATAPDLAKALFMSIKEIEALSAENERLREALMDIANGAVSLPKWAEAMACAALGEAK